MSEKINEIYFKNLFEFFSEPLIILNKTNLKVLYCNSEFQNLISKSSKYILNNSLEDIFSFDLFFLSNLLSLFYIYWISKKISKGKNWSRLLYTASSIIGFYFAFSHQNKVGTNDLLSLIFFILFTTSNIYALFLLYGNKEIVSSFSTN